MADETKNETSNETPVEEPKEIYVQLAPKFQDFGFTDPETRFDLSRDQVKELGVNVGTMTATLLANGSLLKVPKPKTARGK